LPEKNYVITPGLTDLHTHLFEGQDLGVSAEQYLLSAGVVRAIDAGSAGGHLFKAFRNSVIDKSAIEIRTFLNIASIGTTSLYLQGDLMTPAYSNVDLAVNTIRDHSELIRVLAKC
jgi:dihydroorotase